MCGILGVVKNSDAPKDWEFDLRAWAKTIEHRGPDEFGKFENKHISLGSQRLSIIDISHGQQPYFNESKDIIVVFNGQIYNYRSLRNFLNLKGHTFRSEVDGEIIPHLYEEFGPQFVSKIDGMFAIALWDARKNSLYLFRDRVGKKPLLYTIDDNGHFIFSSELKSLISLCSFSTSDVSLDSLGFFLTLGYVPNPYSIFNDVSKLAPGSFLKFQDGIISITKYWEPLVLQNPNSLKENLRIFNELFEDSVAKRLVSERPMGAFLSGGIDSSLVVAYMTKLLAEPVRTFSIGFPDDKFDETIHADEVSRKFNSIHKTIRIQDSDVSSLFDSSFLAYDEPFADSSTLATYAVSQLAAKNIVVALSGDGGDEAFGGYDRYRYLSMYNKIKIPLALLSIARKNIPGIDGTLPKKLNTILDKLPTKQNESLFYLSMMSTVHINNVSIVFQNKNLNFPEKLYDFLVSKFLSQNSQDRYMKGNIYDLNTYLPDDLMYKVDIASMANSLEVRSPFLDHEIIEFGLSLKKNQRIGTKGKILLRAIAQIHLPYSVVNRPKMGFGIPRERWLKGILKNKVDDAIFSRDSLMYSWLDQKEIKIIYQNFMNGKKLDGVIWNLLAMETWARNWIK
jgi:asparagine synthase (glutamine-hydrolysing)